MWPAPVPSAAPAETPARWKLRKLVETQRPAQATLAPRPESVPPMSLVQTQRALAVTQATSVLPPPMAAATPTTSARLWLAALLRFQVLLWASARTRAHAASQLLAADAPAK